MPSPVPPVAPVTVPATMAVEEVVAAVTAPVAVMAAAVTAVTPVAPMAAVTPANKGKHTGSLNCCLVFYSGCAARSSRARIGSLSAQGHTEYSGACNK
jgi:hypothetical protein